MKKRIQIDTAILALFIVLTGVLFVFPELYSKNRVLNNLMMFLGVISLLKGTFLRMAARGHKKAHSHQGAGLVTSGLYQYTRNPMYLGTFLLGCGFVLIVWPWWGLLVYAPLFYARFLRQIILEEKHLRKLFGKTYLIYCERVPRIFPIPSALWKMDAQKVLNWKETWSTKERWGLASWPAMAICLKTLQQQLAFGAVDLGQTIITFLAAALVFTIGLLWRYQMGKK